MVLLVIEGGRVPKYQQKSFDSNMNNEAGIQEMSCCFTMFYFLMKANVNIKTCRCTFTLINNNIIQSFVNDHTKTQVHILRNIYSQS